MSKHLLKYDNLTFKTMIINLKERIIIRQLLFILLGVFLFTTGLNAQEVSIQVGSTTREMIIYAPPGIEPNRPLIISMHGMNQTMYDQKNQTQFQSVAQANNFVLVFPQSNGSQWQLWGTSDIDFILAIIDEMYTQYGIDRDRVYLSGFSMGGMMTYYAATQIADKIAAFAPVSGFLMSGPNAVSSRPIPIIHIHGADDNYVPVSDVQTHMDAWIARNGCPTTAVVTNPYPANVPTAKSIKKYWGPGNDGVEIVFISVAGVGHWYSDNNWSADGIFTSQEIWNFCMKYSLKDGVPEFKYASVNDTNPKQIQLSLSAPIVDSIKFTGFTVKIDNQVVAIDSVVIGDTNQLVINLHDSILNDNEITLAYSNGNVFSILEKELISFNDTLVDNLLKGASPRILELSTNENGSALFANFNMNMKIPSDVSGLSLNAEYNGLFNLPILQVSFFENDSTILYFQVSETVYRDYELTFSYLGNSIVSADSGLLKTISDFPVTNNSNGLPVHINSGKIEADGITLTLEFSKAMALVNGQSSYIKLNKNGENAVINGSSVSNNSIILSLSKSVHYGDTVTISYTPGTIKAADNGPLESFTDFTINNQVNAPTWIQIPGKIEAENFTFKSGMQTEATGDAGGGLNLGYIGDGNWLEYTIENNSSETEYQISFRIAAPSTGGIIDFYIDDINAGQITTPNTGNWQVYKSVVADISITQGKHYLKVVATKAGFNLNYIDIQGLSSGLRELTRADITIYPNPAWNEMTISSVDFRHNKIEVYNTLGGLVMSKATAGEPVLRIPINLFNGIYFVKICNDKQYLLKKLMVANE